MAINSLFKNAFILLALSFISFNTKADITTAIANGNWTSAATWDNGVPQNGDVVIIPVGIVVSVSGVNSTTYVDIVVQVDGELKLNNGQKLDINCNSLADIRATGVLSGDNAGSTLKVCGDEVFHGGGAPLNGPATFGRAPLPIELISFNATATTTAFEIEWQTATETNNDFFTIEKSTNGVSYETISTIDGAGNSTALLSYSFVDAKPIEGVSYYRLKQTDFDGKFAYSAIIAARFEKTLTANDISIYPNPCANICNINVAGATAESIAIEVFDVTGKKVYSNTLVKNQIGKFSFNAKENLNVGVYFIKIDSQKDIVKKIIVQ